MAYRVPTLDEMLGFGVALFRGLLPTRAIGSRFTPAWKLVKTIAGMATDIHAHVDTAVRDFMPTTAEGAALVEWIDIKAPGGSRFLKAATPARKANAARVTGTPGSATVVGDQLRDPSTGLLFQISKAATVPAAGFVDTDIVAIDVGARTRLQKGTVLNFLAPPPGIKTPVELQLDLDEDGEDIEQPAAARNRLLAAFREPTAGGNQADYIAWMLAYAGVAQAFAYRNRAGIGTVDNVALHAGTGTARIFTAGEITPLLAYLREKSPGSLGGVAVYDPPHPGDAGTGLRVLEVLGQDLDVELVITADGQAQYAPDWDDGTAPVVSTWDGVTRELAFTTARPASLKAGDRIALKGVASVQDGAPLVVEALSGNSAVILQAAPPVAPAATDIVYAGGPLTAPVRDALLAHINGDILYAASTGPLPAAVAVRDGISTSRLQVLVSGLGPSNPSGKYGSWSGTFKHAAARAIAIYTRGVNNATVLLPAADQEATEDPYPDDYYVRLLVPRSVLVRYA